WGKDLSGTLQGAGGVGGLLYLTVDGAVYVPFYDNNGNVTRYLDANGNTVAQYTYDAFGNTTSQSGPLADFFRHRFSTKYYDIETGLYYYGHRFYHPILIRRLNRAPLEEDGGHNLMSFVMNNPATRFDTDGYFVLPIMAIPDLRFLRLTTC
ncbi:MAG: RHS repeat-associated core domain-containing protein, partial [Kiritimatiellae bacterium]|nr:RHS repeat-associated core domain-containing protein [Kiritimatiellia bacterium]